MAQRPPKPEGPKVDPMALLVEVEKAVNGFSMNRFRGEVGVSPHSDEGRDLSVELGRAMTFLEDKEFVDWNNVTGIKLWTLTAKGRKVLQMERQKQ